MESSGDLGADAAGPLERLAGLALRIMAAVSLFPLVVVLVAVTCAADLAGRLAGAAERALRRIAG